jgi:hypothetical protein
MRYTPEFAADEGEVAFRVWAAAGNMRHNEANMSHAFFMARNYKWANG